MKNTNLLLRLLFLSIIFTACTEDNDIAPVQGDFDNGIIISAEGNFGDKDGSVAFLDGDMSRKATNFIYTSVNNAQLGGLVQSIGFSEEDAFIIINDAHAIAVVDRVTFDKKTIVLEELKNPRYMVVEGGKGYVTNWGEGGDPSDDYIAVLNLETYAVESKISLKNGVEHIVAKDGFLYVSHKGAWVEGNLVSVVNTSTNTVVAEIEVNYRPDEMFFTKDNSLVVLCEGSPVYDASWNVIGNSQASITYIDTQSNSVDKHVNFAENKRANHIAYNSDQIYYVSDEALYTVNTTDSSLPATSMLEIGSIYGMNVKDGNLYTVKKEFENLSQLNVTAIEGANAGELIHSSAVGLGASKIYFN